MSVLPLPGLGSSDIMTLMTSPPEAINQGNSEAAAVAIAVQVMPEAEDLPLPCYATAQSSGMDLRAAIPEAEGRQIVLQPGRRVLISTGLRIALPTGFAAQVRPRSGLAIKHGVTVINSPGTVDADYRGTIKVGLVNLGTEPFVINHGDRIAQMIIAPVTQGTWRVVSELPETGRGPGGFGSTGQ